MLSSSLFCCIHGFYPSQLGCYTRTSKYEIECDHASCAISSPKLGPEERNICSSGRGYHQNTKVYWKSLRVAKTIELKPNSMQLAGKASMPAGGPFIVVLSAGGLAVGPFVYFSAVVCKCVISCSQSFFFQQPLLLTTCRTWC